MPKFFKKSPSASSVEDFEALISQHESVLAKTEEDYDLGKRQRYGEVGEWAGRTLVRGWFGVAKASLLVGTLHLFDIKLVAPLPMFAAFLALELHQEAKNLYDLVDRRIHNPVRQEREILEALLKEKDEFVVSKGLRKP